MQINDEVRAEWRRGWPLVGAAAIGMSMGGPLVIATMSMFIVPLETEFGWSRAALASGMTVNAATSILLSSLMGLAIDRIGPRRIGMGGVVLFSACFALMATNSGSLAHWWLLWLLLSLSMLTVKPTVWVVAVASRFDAARGMALALVLSGSTLITIVGPPYTRWLIDSFDWRGAYVGLAATGAMIVLPTLALAFFSQTDLVRLGRAAPSQPVVNAPPHAMSGGRAIRSSHFIRLALACGLGYFPISGTTLHFSPILSERNFAPGEVVLLISVLGGAMLAGRVLAGYWLDRFPAKIFACLCFGAPVIGFLILLNSDGSLLWAVVATITIGMANGAEIETASFLIARNFGIQVFGLLLGTVMAVLSLVAGTAPVLFGFLYDKFGTYEPALWLAIPISACASFLILSSNRSSAANHCTPKSDDGLD